jgi:nucleotide-binding universal stress UspA family protein
VRGPPTTLLVTLWFIKAAKMKSVLTYVNGTAGDFSVLSTSLQVGRLFNGHLSCHHVVPNRASLVGPATNVDLTAAMSLTDAIQALEIEAAKRVVHARESFFAFCEDKHLAHADGPRDSISMSASWHEHKGKPIAILTEEARLHDLTILEGGPKRDLILSEDDIGKLIVSSGRPVLLVPSAIQGKSLKSIAIAWKNCAEAARAVTAAMPLLAKAEKIVVLSANEHGDKSESAGDDLDRFVDYLRGQGFDVKGECVVSGTRSIPDAVIGKAIESRAGLLVMGAFGHSRLREFIFGGFTQRVLDGASLPVLLFH